MTQFTDCKGNSWKVPALSVGLIEDIKEQAGIDIYLAMEDKEKFAELVFSPRAIGSLLWCLCEEAAKAMNLDERAFARLFDGPTIERAGVALMELLADFCPRSQVGKWRRANLRANLDMMDQAIIAELSKPSTGSPVSAA